MLGGSTTSLISLMNNLDFDRYEVDLQLFQNTGELIDYIPKKVNLLSPAKKYKSTFTKNLAFLFSGYLFKALFKSLQKKKIKLDMTVISEFVAKKNSRKNKKHYDYAIGFLEGWSARYLAYGVVNAEKKYAWLHSTFANITKDPKSQIPWMNLVDKIVFVTDACCEDFKKTMPEMADKAITIENITDSALIRKRSEDISEEDIPYKLFCNSEKFKIVTVCRIDISTKGLDRIINAAKDLKNRGKDFIWYVIGSGRDEAKFNELIKMSNLEDRLFAIGIRMNPYPFIKAADIMCMPSRYEGKPMVITESMILGTPPVVTQYLSANDQIKTGIEGLVLPNEDNSLSEPLIDLINSPEKINIMREYLLSNDYGNTAYIKVIEKTLLN